MSTKYYGLHVILMTNYSMLTETSLTADWGSYQPCWLPRIQTTRMSHKSEQYLTNSSLDHSTRLEGQTHLLLPFGGSLALLQVTLWHHPPIRVKPHHSMSFPGWRWTSSWTWGWCRGPHEGHGIIGTTCRCGSWAVIISSGSVGLGQLQWQWPHSFALRPWQ